MTRGVSPGHPFRAAWRHTPDARRTNLALFVVLALALATGTGAFAAGTRSWGVAIVIAHGVVGLAVLVLARPKARVIRRGWRVGRASRWASAVLGVLVVVTVVTGFAHSAGLRSLGVGVTAMQVHVGAALGSIPLLVWHTWVRPASPRRTDLSRRAALQAGATLGLAGVGWLGWERTAAAPRRFTGSHELAAPLVTQWLFDRVPRVDPETWKVVVAGRSLHLADLQGHDDRASAVIDCTGGWYATQEWEGVRLDRLLAGVPGAADAGSIVVRSLTGYSRRFPPDAAPHLLLAVRAAGEPLSAGHGAPARLVAPGRRGFWWVKWVAEISYERTPWWAQPPFPLQ